MPDAPRCCGACGRWGNRMFFWDAENEWWVCRNDRACHARIVAAARPMPATRDLLATWDATTNPILLSAAGQLRAALRKDGRSDVAEVTPPINLRAGSRLRCTYCGEWGHLNSPCPDLSTPPGAPS